MSSLTQEIGHDRGLLFRTCVRRLLAHALGEQFVQAMLFGSRARGEAQPDSDIDVLVIVPGEVNYMDLLRRTSALVAELLLAHDVVLRFTISIY